MSNEVKFTFQDEALVAFNVPPNTAFKIERDIDTLRKSGLPLYLMQMFGCHSCIAFIKGQEDKRPCYINYIYHTPMVNPRTVPFKTDIAQKMVMRCSGMNPNVYTPCRSVGENK